MPFRNFSDDQSLVTNVPMLKQLLDTLEAFKKPAVRRQLELGAAQAMGDEGDWGAERDLPETAGSEGMF